MSVCVNVAQYWFNYYCLHYACLLRMSCALFVTNVGPFIVLDNVIRAWTLSSRVLPYRHSVFVLLCLFVIYISPYKNTIAGQPLVMSPCHWYLQRLTASKKQSQENYDCQTRIQITFGTTTRWGTSTLSLEKCLFHLDLFECLPSRAS